VFQKPKVKNVLGAESTHPSLWYEPHHSPTGMNPVVSPSSGMNPCHAYWYEPVMSSPTGMNPVISYWYEY
jgi:hypothetical protein